MIINGNKTRPYHDQRALAETIFNVLFKVRLSLFISRPSPRVIWILFGSAVKISKSPSIFHCNRLSNIKKDLFYDIFKRRGEERAGLQNTDDFFLKLLIYRRIFFKIATSKIFSASQGYMYLQATRTKFFQDLTNDKIHVL